MAVLKMFLSFPDVSKLHGIISSLQKQASSVAKVEGKIHH